MFVPIKWPALCGIWRLQLYRATRKCVLVAARSVLQRRSRVIQSTDRWNLHDDAEI